MKIFFHYCKSPLFLLGLVLRLALIAIVLPSPVGDWYAPFMELSVGNIGVDPWKTWLSQGGSQMAFPYGYAMWLFLMPLSILCKVFLIPVTYAYGLSLLMADLGLLLLLGQLLQLKERLLLVTYWLSPISLVASYCFGYNDIIPVFLLMGAICFIKQHRFVGSGIFLILAISAKLSMVLSLPFFLIYLFHNRSLRPMLPKFLIGLGLSLIVFFLPFLFSESGINMLANNPEMEKVYELSIELTRNTSIYLVPLAYLMMLYAAWRVKRMNFELFNAVLGVAFLLVVLLTPASPGWYIWILPLLISYQASGDRAAIYITSAFSFLYVLSVISFMGLQFPKIFTLDLSMSWPLLANDHFISLIHTTLVANGIILAVRIWRETISRNDFFRLSRKPFVIGVAGDSGAGKDTFTNAIASLFGKHSVAIISGDDYHLWDRHQPMWKVMTHINPAANDLESFAKNLVSLVDGREIQSRHYDHGTGKLGRPLIVRSNDVIFSSGLHALYLPILRECYDLSIYLDIDEDLRAYFKIHRDVKIRGYSIEKVIETLAQRQTDSDKFIRPQAAHANLIMSLQPISPLNPHELTGNPPRLRLVVKSRNGCNELSLKRVLVGVCGLHVDMNTIHNTSEVELSIEGESSAQDIKIAAQLICPQIFDFLDLKPQWEDGVLGLMQLITLSYINQALTRRFI